jgi:hypothetical protein
MRDIRKSLIRETMLSLEVFSHPSHVVRNDGDSLVNFKKGQG